MRADADDLDAEGFEQALLPLRDAGAVDRILVLDPHLELVHRLLQRRSDQIAQGVDRALREGARVGPRADVVGQAAGGQLLGQRDGLEVQLVEAHRSVARGVGDAAGVGAGEQVDLLLVHQLFDGLDALLRIGRVAVHDLDLAAEHAAAGVGFFGSHLEAARHLGAVLRSRPAERVDRTDLEGLLCVSRRQQRRVGERDGDDRRGEETGHVNHTPRFQILRITEAASVSSCRRAVLHRRCRAPCGA